MTTESHESQLQHLRALYETGLMLAGDVALDVVLQRVVDLACRLSGATYGALGIFGADNQIEQFITSGMSPEDRSRLGPLPRGRGLLGEMLKAHGPVRVANIGHHPASVGFPRGHPQMISFLGVPVVREARTVGILYLTDKKEASEFSADDAALLELFAAQAAAALENARLHRDLRQQALQLRELYRAGLAVSADLSIDTVLQRVIDLARELTGATYGALGVLGKDGNLEQFITSGISQHERERIGPLPKGRGLLGAMLHSTEPIRVKNLKEHHASVGFPEGHPPMTSFLGVPVVHRGQLLGSLYLTDKRGAEEFDESDEALVVLFAIQVGLAIENARLHAHVQQLAVEEDRQRIAREMHDGLAQLIGYVNVKTGAVRRLIDTGKVQEASKELEDLERAARSAYADVREGILGLRVITQTEGGLVAALKAYAEQFEQQSVFHIDVATKFGQRELKFTAAAEIQLIRVVQEALSNVRKHSGARAAAIHIAVTDTTMSLSIRDDGTGYGSASQSGSDGPRFGLKIMHERAQSLGGSIEFESEPGKGTTVLVTVPRQH